MYYLNNKFKNFNTILKSQIFFYKSIIPFKNLLLY